MYWHWDALVQWISTAELLPWAFLPASVTLPSRAANAPTSLAAVFNGQEGTKVKIPNVSQLCPPWSMRKNLHHEKIYDDFTTWVKLWYKDEHVRRKLFAMDAPLYVAMAYPGTSHGKLLILAKLIAWYFPWDDAIDDGELSHSLEQLHRYRDETIKIVDESLGPSTSIPSTPHPNPTIQSFFDLGTEIRADGKPETNLRLRNEQCAFITSSVQSQTERESAAPVTVAAYLKRRQNNIGVYCLIETIYYAYSIQIPEKYSHLQNKHMRIMREELARMATISNDILSLRREAMHGQFESLVPLLMYHEHLSPQAGVDRAMVMMTDSYTRFDAAERTLYANVDPDSLPRVQAYVQACKDLLVSSLYWSYGLKRYMEKGMLQADGSVVFDIRLPPQHHA